MSLKFETNCNDDNFVQNGDELQELTVTITLCEYRNLAKDIAYQDSTIEKLKKENENLKNQVKVYGEYILANHPEIIEKFGSIADMLINSEMTDRPTEKGGGSDA